MCEAKSAIRKASIDWRDGSVPVSRTFDDPYYSVGNGLAETRHVFLNGNHLPDRWPPGGDFIVAELGFGTGLNFLETARTWLSLMNNGQNLHYHSFEQFPMSSLEMEKALQPWPELSHLAKELISVWTVHGPRIEMSIDSVMLTVHFGDANLLLPTMKLGADAWYLDGFSPVKNPELWSFELMKAVYLNTAENGTFATYSAAGWVRRNLTQAGFRVAKSAGYGRKREMCLGLK